MGAARFVDGGAAARGGVLDPARASAGIAAALTEAGVEAGDRVVLSCEPSVATVAAYAGILRAGGVVVPANTGYTRRELEHIVGDVRPVLAVTSDPTRFDGLLDTRAPHELFTAAAAAREALDGAVAGTAEDVLRRSDDPAMIAFTSGTTGAPKGAVLSHANLRASAESVVEAWHWTADDVLVLALPLFHMHGLGVGVNGTLVAGARAVVLPRFDPDAVLDAIAEHDATMFFGVPTMYARLAEHPRLAELGALRLCVSGSAPLAPSLWQRIADGGGQHVLERYGMSETAMLTSNPYEGERRPGSVGRPLPGVQVRLGAAGSVEVRGPNVFADYWDRPAATAAAFTADGWFRTGDIGELDADGYLTLIGRGSELIITGGYNVYPREVEDVVRRHDGVDDVAVVGVPDEVWGERVVGFVVPRDPATAGLLETGTRDALDALCVEGLADYKRPRAWLSTEALPRNAMGKVQRDVLRDRAAAALGASVDPDPTDSTDEVIA